MFVVVVDGGRGGVGGECVDVLMCRKGAGRNVTKARFKTKSVDNGKEQRQGKSHGLHFPPQRSQMLLLILLGDEIKVETINH